MTKLKTMLTALCTLSCLWLQAPDLQAQIDASNKVGDIIEFSGVRCKLNKIANGRFGSKTYKLSVLPSADPAGYQGDITITSNYDIDSNTSIGVDSISANAFKDCRNLNSVIIQGAALTYIGDNAFSNSSVETIQIPYYATNFGKSPFANCQNLKTFISNVENPDEFVYDTSNGSTPFMSTPLSGCRLYVPMQALTKYQAKPYWSQFGSMSVMALQYGDEFAYNDVIYRVRSNSVFGYTDVFVVGLEDDDATSVVIPESFEVYPITYKPSIVLKEAFKLSAQPHKRHNPADRNTYLCLSLLQFTQPHRRGAPRASR